MKLVLFPLLALSLAETLDGYAPSTIPYKQPQVSDEGLLMDTVSTTKSAWTDLENSKFSGQMKPMARKYVSVEMDLGLQMTTPSAYHGVARSLSRSWNPETDSKFFFTMEVQQEDPVNCGGAYVKLFSSEETDGKISKFDDTTPYSIMFGPDRCGYATNKVHFIIKWNKDGEFLEAHLDAPPKTKSSSEAHQYGFMLSKEDGLRIYVDGEVALEGADLAKLFRKNDFSTPEEIPDVNDVKPEDWVDETHIPDPKATKPSDWPEDEPEMIPDEDAVMPDGWLVDEPELIVNEDAVKPSDWNDEEDGTWMPPRIRNPACSVGCGEWQRPMVANPKYRGEWQPPMIENPDYTGPWSPRMIPNPNHWKVDNPYQVIRPFNAVGIELWTVEAGTMFDNFYATTNEQDFLTFIKDTYEYKKDVEAANLKLREELLEKEALEKKETEEAASDSWFSYLMSGSNTTILLSLMVPVVTTLFWLRKTLLPSKTVLPPVVPRAEDKKEEEEVVADEGDAAKEVTSRKASSDGEEKTPEQPISGAETSAPTSAKQPEEKKKD